MAVTKRQQPNFTHKYVPTYPTEIPAPDDEIVEYWLDRGYEIEVRFVKGTPAEEINALMHRHMLRHNKDYIDLLS